MLIILPIRTECAIRRPPRVNYALILANAFCFLLTGTLRLAPQWATKAQFFSLHADEPALYQFLTYQFLHADFLHLFGNMLFLWVFGNGVNAKMGDLPYLLFYLAAGVFAGWGFTLVTPQPARLIGASGAIAGVTTAYLALFPRSRVTVLIWLFIFIHFVQVPALLLIGLKIIVWDNLIAPSLGQAAGIANSAHLAGYLFGFVGALVMLFIRALPRDQFDILALWKRWHQRRAFAAALSDPNAAARARFGAPARVEAVDAQQREAEERRLDEINDLRTRIAEELERRNLSAASALYEQLVAIDDKQCLSERSQLEIAREFYGNGRSSQAAAAFERFVSSYPNSREAGDMRLLLGIIYARDLRQYEAAADHLTRSMEILRDPARRTQCSQWLHNVYGALGRPAPNP